MSDGSATPERPEVSMPEESRANSDRMLEMVTRLREIETAKRRHPIGSPEFVRHAAEAEELSRLIFRWSQMQGALAEDALGTGGMPVTIEDVPSRPIHDLLADWREAELRLLGARPGSAEAHAATDRIERLREEYRRVVEEQRAAGE